MKGHAIMCKWNLFCLCMCVETANLILTTVKGQNSATWQDYLTTMKARKYESSGTGSP